MCLALASPRTLVTSQRGFGRLTHREQSSGGARAPWRRRRRRVKSQTDQHWSAQITWLRVPGLRTLGSSMLTRTRFSVIPRSVCETQLFRHQAMDHKHPKKPGHGRAREMCVRIRRAVLGSPTMMFISSRCLSRVVHDPDLCPCRWLRGRPAVPDLVVNMPHGFGRDSPFPRQSCYGVPHFESIFARSCVHLRTARRPPCRTAPHATPWPRRRETR